MVYLCNAFSLNMLQNINEITLKIRKLDLEETNAILSLGFESAVGHQDLARILEGLLGVSIPVNRKSITITEEDVLIVAQYVGNRLPEGATALPEGARIEFFEVRIQG